jgi:hypothetical protein
MEDLINYSRISSRHKIIIKLKLLYNYNLDLKWDGTIDNA